MSKQKENDLTKELRLKITQKNIDDMYGFLIPQRKGTGIQSLKKIK